MFIPLKYDVFMGFDRPTIPRSKPSYPFCCSSSQSPWPVQLQPLQERPASVDFALAEIPELNLTGDIIENLCQIWDVPLPRWISVSTKGDPPKNSVHWGLNQQPPVRACKILPSGYFTGPGKNGPLIGWSSQLYTWIHEWIFHGYVKWPDGMSRSMSLF